MTALDMQNRLHRLELDLASLERNVLNDCETMRQSISRLIFDIGMVAGNAGDEKDG